MASPRYFLLADDIHLHERNFGPLFKFVAKHAVECDVHLEHRALKQRLGNYSEAPEIAQARARLARLSSEELFRYEHAYRGTPLRIFPLCRSEALAYSLAACPQWQEQLVPADDASVFEFFWSHDRDVLLDNAAAAMFWIESYSAFLEARSRPHTHAFIFNGSMIYTRVLMEVLRFYRTKVFVLESTFTGREFYCEERYTPIANASDIRLATVRNAIRLPQDPVARQREEVKAVERVFRAENKNVRQPPSADAPRFRPGTKTLLVIGQVANDFSIIEQRRGYVTSVAFYRELIGRVLRETDYNVIFKGHPWEHKKTHLKGPYTRRLLEEFARTLTEEQRERFAIRDEDNLEALGRLSHRVALLNSQAGIELAFFCGLRPSTFGSPYFGGAGFTDDYDGIDDFVQDLRLGQTEGLLDVDSYARLLHFLHLFLRHHVATERAEGVRWIERRFAEKGRINALHRAPGEAGGSETKARRDASPSNVVYRKLRKLIRNPSAFLRHSKLVQALKAR